MRGMPAHGRRRQAERSSRQPQPKKKKKFGIGDVLEDAVRIPEAERTSFKPLVDESRPFVERALR